MKMLSYAHCYATLIIYRTHEPDSTSVGTMSHCSFIGCFIDKNIGLAGQYKKNKQELAEKITKYKDCKSRKRIPLIDVCL